MVERARRTWRPWLRALHRDIGYLGVGLTLVYALSGLAVNHIAAWDPNFKQIHRTHQLASPLAGSDENVAERVRRELGVDEPVRELYRASDARLDIVFDRRTLHVDASRGLVEEEGQQPRFFLRAANYLHLNRGKKAWSYAADAYACALLFLAISGLFMLPGRRGVLGRGAIFVAIGAAVPVLYVLFSPLR
jgi:hypothetical protein